MRIEKAPGEPVRSVYIWLTRTEAGELRGTLDQMLADESLDRHEHVSSSDYQTEITLAWDRS
jgi:hypothetical protein